MSRRMMHASLSDGEQIKIVHVSHTSWLEDT